MTGNPNLPDEHMTVIHLIEPTSDMWAFVADVAARKQQFIDQIMNSAAADLVDATDTDGQTMTYAALKAIATGGTETRTDNRENTP